MVRAFGRKLVFGAVLAAIAGLSASTDVQARDFFSSFFNSGGPVAPQPSVPLSYAPDSSNGSLFGDAQLQAAPRTPPRAVHASHQAFCVRTCDGRYFPVEVADGQSRAASCNNFCPASDTKVFSGSTIDHAVSESGKQYSALPNAFRYRNEIVAGCTCNGKDAFGLAQIKIEEDRTVRKGDIVAGENGLMVAGHSADKRGASLDLSPASASVRSRYARLPVVASD